MKKYWIQMSVFVLAGALAGPVLAQSADSGGAAQGTEKAVATVHTEGGVIMLSSQDGPFTTAQQDEPVVSGDRLMVAKDSKAKVVYNDGCNQVYSKAGIYKIEPNCKRAAAYVPESTTGWTTGQVLLAGAGGAALGAIIEHRRCDCKCPPVSH